MGPPANKSPYSSMCDGGCGRCLDPQWAYCSLSCKLGLAGAGEGEGATTNPMYGSGNMYDRSVPSGGVIAFITTTNTGAFNKGGKRSSTKYGSGNNLAGTTASNSDQEDGEDCYYSNNNFKNRNSNAYKRAMMMVSRKALKGAKRRKSIYPVRSDSL